MATLTHLPDPRVGPPRPLPEWVLDALAGVFIVVAGLAPFPAGEFRPHGLLGHLTVLAPVVLLPWRRRWQLSVLAGCVALFGLAAWQQTLSPGAGAAVALGVFTVGNRRDRRTTVVTAAGAALVMVLLSLYGTRASGFDPRIFQTAVTLAFAAAVGDATRSRREYVRAVTERADRAEQTRESEARRRVVEERLRIARDLHDAVAHQIAVINLKAGVASETLGARPEKAREALAVIRTASRTVLGEISDLLQLLRADDESGEEATRPQPGLERVDDLVATFDRSGLQVTVRTEGDLSAVDGATGIVAHHVIQEGLTNAHKHGAEHRAHVLVEATEGRLRIAVTNPVDFSPRVGTHPAPPSGHGLLGLRERVASVRGSLEAGPLPGRYLLTAVLPLHPDRTAPIPPPPEESHP